MTETATNCCRRGGGVGLWKHTRCDQLGGECLQGNRASLSCPYSALRSLPETRARERRARNKRTSVRVYFVVGRGLSGAGTGMRRIGSGTRGLRRKATLQTRLLALLRSDDCKATTLWFADVPEPAGLEEMAAATMRTLRDSRPLCPSAAALIELGNCALQSVELGRDGVE